MLQAWALVMLLLWGPAGLADAGPGQAATATRSEMDPPEAVARGFYAWYLGQLAENKDPLQDGAATLSAYVAPALVKDITRCLRSREGMEADYFLQAQDYLDDWASHIEVAAARIQGSSASTLVTLGADRAKPYRLSIGLLQDKGVWKIRKVARL